MTLWRRFVRYVLPPLVPLIVVIAALEVVAQRQWVPRYILPPPSKVYEVFSPKDPVLRAAQQAELWKALWRTTEGSLAGFALSAALGVFLGVLLASSRWVQRAFYPYAVFFQTVPIIAVAPLLVIWCGFGLPTVITSAFIVSVFPVIANTLAGMRSVDPALRDMFRLYRAGPLSLLFRLHLPAALPNILTGLRIAAGLAVIGAIVGEFITGGGIGGMIDSARTQQRVDKVFAGLLLSALLGIAMFLVINLTSRFVLRKWHASEAEA